MTFEEALAELRARHPKPDLSPSARFGAAGLPTTTATIPTTDVTA